MFEYLPLKKEERRALKSTPPPTPSPAPHHYLITFFLVKFLEERFLGPLFYYCFPNPLPFGFCQSQPPPKSPCDH